MLALLLVLLLLVLVLPAVPTQHSGSQGVDSSKRYCPRYRIQSALNRPNALAPDWESTGVPFLLTGQRFFPVYGEKNWRVPAWPMQCRGGLLTPPPAALGLVHGG